MEYRLTIQEWLRVSETRKNHQERLEFVVSRSVFRFVVFRGYILTHVSGKPRKTYARLDLWHKWQNRTLLRKPSRITRIHYQAKKFGYIRRKRLRIAFENRAPLSMKIPEFKLHIAAIFHNIQAWRAWAQKTYMARPLWALNGNFMLRPYRPNAAPQQIKWLDYH
jgi:hypothetical protein